MLSADLAPLYEHLCKELGWQIDAAQLEGMKARNTEKLKELDEKIKDAEENLGETEVRDAVQAKADYYAQIGDRDAAAKAYQDTESKTASVATKTDLVFNQIRWAAQKQAPHSSYCCCAAAFGSRFLQHSCIAVSSKEAASSLPTCQVQQQCKRQLDRCSSNPDVQGYWSTTTWLQYTTLTGCALLPQAQHPVQRLAHGEAAAGARQAAVRVRRRLGAQEQAQGEQPHGGGGGESTAGGRRQHSSTPLVQQQMARSAAAVAVHAGQAMWADGQALTPGSSSSSLGAAHGHLWLAPRA